MPEPHRRCSAYILEVNGSYYLIDMGTQVIEDLRRRGIGTALIKTMKARLAAQGIKTVTLSVSEKNVSAIRFYEKNGFRTLLKAFGFRVMRAETEE